MKLREVLILGMELEHNGDAHSVTLVGGGALQKKTAVQLKLSFGLLRKENSSSQNCLIDEVKPFNYCHSVLTMMSIDIIVRTKAANSNKQKYNKRNKQPSFPYIGSLNEPKRSWDNAKRNVS